MLGLVMMIGFGEGFIIYEVLYFMFEAEASVSFMAKFLMEVVVFVRFQV